MTTLDAIKRQIDALSDAERAALLTFLTSDGGSTDAIAGEWRAECDRRYADMRAGRSVDVPAEVVFARLQPTAKSVPE